MPGDAPPRVDPDRYARVMALNDYLFNELHFVGNEVQYEDPRNSFLNEVLDRRTGIPITLALLYMEVARRAGLHVEGINFPGHFLLRCPARLGLPYSEDLIIDAFHGGALLSEDACRELLRRHAGDEAVFDSPSAGPRHEAADSRADAVEPEARLRAACIRSRRPATSPSCCWRSTRRPPTSSATAGCWPTPEGFLGGASRSAGAISRSRRQRRSTRTSGASTSEIWEHVKTLRRRVASLN